SPSSAASSAPRRSQSGIFPAVWPLDLGRHRLAAFLADPRAVPVFQLLRDRAGRLVAGLTDDADVGRVQGRFLLDARAVRMLLRAAQVLPDEVHALDEDPSRGRVDLEDLPRLAPFLARDDLDDVVLADAHTTSAASEMIFMNLLRSSRGTAPKMRVPRGLPSASRSTIAFRSNRTYEPSSRRMAALVRTMTPFTTSPCLIAAPGSARLTLATTMSPTLP